MLEPPLSLPEVEESETKPGAAELRETVQFSGVLPVLLIEMAREAEPLVALMVSLDGLADKAALPETGPLPELEFPPMLAAFSVKVTGSTSVSL